MLYAFFLILFICKFFFFLGLCLIAGLSAFGIQVMADEAYRFFGIRARRYFFLTPDCWRNIIFLIGILFHHIFHISSSRDKWYFSYLARDPFSSSDFLSSLIREDHIIESTFFKYVTSSSYIFLLLFASQVPRDCYFFLSFVYHCINIDLVCISSSSGFTDGYIFL